jgi:hypothetical protein
MAEFIITAPPGGIVPANTRPTSAAQVTTDQAQRAFKALVEVESRLVEVSAAATEAARAIRGSTQLTVEGQTARMGEWAARIGSEVARIAALVQGSLVVPARGTVLGVRRTVEQRDAGRSPGQWTFVANIQQTLQALADNARNAVLIAALQNGEVPVLESVHAWPRSLDSVDGCRLSGTIQELCGRDVIEQRYADLVAGELATARNELRAIAAAGCFEVSMVAGALAKLLMVDTLPSERLGALRADWQLDGLDTFTDSDLRRATEQANRAQVERERWIRDEASKYVVQEVA